MEKFIYWLRKTFSKNLKFCKCFCVTCEYYETCKDDGVLD